MQGEDRKLRLDTRLMRGNTMKTFVLILAMLAAPLAAQNKQPQNTTPPQTVAQSASGQAAQQPQTVVKPTTKPAQPPLPQQPIVFTAKQFDEYEDKILKRSETFYNNRMTDLLWTMGIIMAAGLAIVGILIPMILERQRRISFARELDTQSQKFNERLSQSEDLLKKYAEEQTEKLRTELISQIDDSGTELEKAISTPLSMAFGGLGGLFSKEISPEGYGLTLQCHVLAKKFSIIGQSPKASLSATQIIKLLQYTNKGSEIKLETLKAVDEVIEGMKGDVDKIIDDEKRVDMESQVEELQIYVHALIHKKQQTTPPQAEEN